MSAGVRSNRPGLGIASVCLGILCLASMDAVAKWLGESYPIVQIVFFRTLFALPPVLLLAWLSGGFHLLRPVRLPVHLLRGALGGGAIVFFFSALRYMPLATVWTIAFAAPLIVTALSRPLLGEPVGPRRWAAVLVGFAGVLVVIQPGTATFEWAMLLALGGTLSYALLLMTARKFSGSETAPAMVLFNMLVPLAVASLITPAVWTPPVGWAWAGFVAAGLLGGSAMIFLTLGYRLAPAAVVAPFDYTALIWSVALGWWIWGDWPTPATWAGATLIVAAGLYVAYRETRGARRAKAPAPEAR